MGKIKNERKLIEVQLPFESRADPGVADEVYKVIKGKSGGRGIPCASQERSMDSSPDEENNIEIWGSDPTCLTFMLRNEDHTLGNALRYVLIKNPDVRFCGYSIPHPSENIMNIRVETYGRPATGLFRKALLDLRAMAEHIGTAFEAEVENFAALQREQ